MAATELDRPAGYLESLCAEFFVQLPAGLQVVAAAVFDGPLDPGGARAALGALYTRHPVLRARLVREPGGWAFRPGATLADVGPAVRSGGSWRESLDRSLATPLVPERALWRAEVVASAGDAGGAGVLVLTGHHAAIDGRSVVTLAGDFALACGPGPAEPRPPRPCLEALFPPADGHEGEVPAGEPAAAWPVERPAPAEARRVGFEPRLLDAATVRGLAERARAEHTTVTGLLAAAAVRAGQGLPGATPVTSFAVPADLRSRATPRLDPDDVGMYIRDVGALAPDATEDLGPLARRLRAAVVEGVPGVTAMPRDVAPEAVAAEVAGLARPDRDRFDLGFALTNLGVVAGPPAAAPAAAPGLAHLWFTAVQPSGTVGLVLSAATTPAGMTLGVSWCEPLRSRAAALAFADRLVAVAERAAGAHPPDAR